MTELGDGTSCDNRKLAQVIANHRVRTITENLLNFMLVWCVFLLDAVLKHPSMTDVLIHTLDTHWTLLFKGFYSRNAVNFNMIDKNVSCVIRLSFLPTLLYILHGIR